MQLRSSSKFHSRDLGTLRVTRPLVATIDHCIEVLSDLYSTGVLDRTMVRLGAGPTERSLHSAIDYLRRATRSGAQFGDRVIAVYVFLPALAVGEPIQMRRLLTCLKHVTFAKCVELHINGNKADVYRYGEAMLAPDYSFH